MMFLCVRFVFLARLLALVGLSLILCVQVHGQWVETHSRLLTMERRGILQDVLPSRLRHALRNEHEKGVLFLKSTSVDDKYWDDRFGPPGIDDADVRAFAVDESTGNLYVGGDFTSAGGMRANSIVRWDGSSWHALGSGVDGTVEAIAVHGKDVYVGGSFFKAGGQLAYGIAKWDGSKWAALKGSVSTGVQGLIMTMVASDTALFVGGSLSDVGGLRVNGIAKWSFLTESWTPLGAGVQDSALTGTVFTMVLDAAMLYAGGRFDRAGTVAVGNLASWDIGTQSWVRFTDGTNGPVTSLVKEGNTMYIGGQFSKCGTEAVNNIFSWDIIGKTANAMGKGVNERITSMDIYQSELFIAGQFTFADGKNIKRITRWNPANSMFSEVATTISGVPQVLARSSSGLLVGGSFYTISNPDEIPVSYVASFDGTWHALEGGVAGGHSTGVFAIASDAENVYVGGKFNRIGEKFMNNIARWERASNTWHTLGPDTAQGVVGEVYSLHSTENELYVGGFFYSAGGKKASNIAAWNTQRSTWSALDNGLVTGTNGAVYGMALDGNTLFIGGAFVYAGSDTVLGITSWDISDLKWKPMDFALRNLYRSVTPDAMTFEGGNLYVGGSFDPLVGNGSSTLARYENNAWYTVSTKFDGSIHALAKLGSKLFVGGDFNEVSGIMSPNLITWNEQSGLFAGSIEEVDAPIYAITATGEQLFLGGDFQNIAQQQVPFIAYRNAFGWNALGSGMDGPVLALSASGYDLFAGGTFLSAGKKPSFHIAKWDHSVLDVETAVAEPISIQLHTIPNPFFRNISIVITLPSSDVVSMRIYNLLGTIVFGNERKEMEKGKHEIQLQAGKLPSGKYIIEVESALHGRVRSGLIHVQ